MYVEAGDRFNVQKFLKRREMVQTEEVFELYARRIRYPARFPVCVMHDQKAVQVLTAGKTDDMLKWKISSHVWIKL